MRMAGWQTKHAYPYFFSQPPVVEPTDTKPYGRCTMARFHTISHDCARELILDHRVNGGGRFFRVAFERVTTSDDERRRLGELEVFMARFNVKAHLKYGKRGWIHPDGSVHKNWVWGARPVGASYDRHEKGVFCCTCVGRRNGVERGGGTGYRCIRFGSVRWLKLNGVVYKVGEPPPPQH